MRTDTPRRLALILGLAALALPAYAVSLDLTAGGSGTVNGAFFTTTDVGSTGTGVIQPFLRVQDNGVADGYNSSSGSLMPDVKSGTWTHDITLGAIPIVTNPTGAATGSYYELLLDINQTGGNPLLSLDKIQIYTRSTAISNASTLANLTSGATLRYDLGGNEVLLNGNLSTGSGSGDLFVYIPTSLFAGASSSDFLYLYSMFGNKGGLYAENDGFEEWSVRSGPTPPPSVPDGGTTAILMGASLIALAAVRRLLAA